MDEPGVGCESSMGFIDTDLKFRVVAIAREQALEGKGFAKTCGVFHPFRCRLDGPSEPVDRRTPLPFGRSPDMELFEIVSAQAPPANRQCYKSVHKQPPVAKR